MQRANSTNINTREFWNEFYQDREGYKQITGNTARFTRTLEEIKDGDKVLDIGCGIGLFTTLVKDTYPNCEVWGVDISDDAIAQNLKERPDIKYNYGKIGSLNDIPNVYFDVVFSGETLEHLDEPKLLFRDAHKKLRRGSKFILTTPKEDAIQTPEHTWYFKQEDIEQLYFNNGFNDVRFAYLPDQEHMTIIYAIGVKQ